MKLTDRQQQFPIPWANMPESGTLSPIPKEDPGDGSASLTKGFPKATMTPIAAGGKPPRGDQFNGIFNQLSLSAQNNAMGVVPAWCADFAQAIGGYPLTAQVTFIKNGVPDILVSLCDNNLDNPLDPRQTNWASVKKGLALSNDLSNYQPKGSYISSAPGADDKPIVNSVYSAALGAPAYETPDGIWHPGFPVGIVAMVPTNNIPWGWLQLAGQSFDQNLFPDLFKFLGTNCLPDYRGRFPRGAGGSWIGVPEIGTYQGDAIRNILGGSYNQVKSNTTSIASGAFRDFAQNYYLSNNGSKQTYDQPYQEMHLNFDASRVVPTDWENRPLSVISNYIIKAL